MEILNTLMYMIESKKCIWTIKEMAELAGYELSSMSMPGMKAEVEQLIEHERLNQEANSLQITLA